MNNLYKKAFAVMLFLVTSIASAGALAPLEPFVPPEGWQKVKNGNIIVIFKDEINFLLYAIGYTKDSKSFFQDVRSETFGDKIKCRNPEIKPNDPMLSEYVTMNCINPGDQSGLATYGWVEELESAVVVIIRTSNDENLNILLKGVLPTIGDLFRKSIE